MKKIAALLFLLSLEISALAGGSMWNRGGSGLAGRGGHGALSKSYSGYVPGDDAPATLLMTIGAILCFIFVFGYLLYYADKDKKAKKQIMINRKFDAFWDSKKMEEHVNAFFPRVQQAWMTRDLHPIHTEVTSDFIYSTHLILNDYHRRKLVNVIQDISIRRITIVDVHDDQDDSKDRFAAVIEGKMKNFLASQDEDIRKKSAETFPELFEDLYIFKRKANRWLLDEIINDPEDWQKKLY